MRITRHDLVLTADEGPELDLRGLYPRHQGSIYFHIRAIPILTRVTEWNGALTDIFNGDQKEVE
jgi:hypothetical protein